MKINFATNNCKTNFKASFANDYSTQSCIRKMAEMDPIDTLAINLALKDIKSDEKLAVWMKSNVFENKLFFKNVDNMQRAIIPDTCLKAILQDLCGESQKLYGMSFKLFNRKKAKLSSEEYIDKAMALIENQVNCPRKYEKQYLVSEIASKEHEISQKKQEVADLRTKLDEIRTDEEERIASFVEELINKS